MGDERVVDLLEKVSGQLTEALQRLDELDNWRATTDASLAKILKASKSAAELPSSRQHFSFRQPHDDALAPLKGRRVTVAAANEDVQPSPTPNSQANPALNAAQRGSKWGASRVVPLEVGRDAEVGCGGGFGGAGEDGNINQRLAAKAWSAEVDFR